MQRSEITPVSDNPTKKQPISRRSIIFFFLLALLLIFAWAGLKAYRLSVAAQSLLATQAEIEALLSDGITNIDPERTEEILFDVRNDVVSIKKETAIFMPLTPYLGWLPEVGPLLKDAPALMEMADAGTETAVILYPALKPVLVQLQSESSPETSQMSALIQILDEAEPSLLAAEEPFQRLLSAREAVGDVAAFPWRIRTIFEQVDPLLEMADDGLRLAPVLPELMGVHAPKTYLIMAQNEDEIRATGGFISGAGLLQVANGRIVSIDFMDGNNVDNWREKPYDFPPQPYYDHMGLELFLFRDANFWPDFPTSAETAIRLYSYGQDVPEADGVIAIDQRFLQYLLQAIGPVQIDATGQTITAKNIITQIQNAWAQPEDVERNEWDRKLFLSVFGAAIQQKIEAGLGDIDPLTLAENMFTAVETKHLQLYMRDPQIAAILDDLNWDGRLQNLGNQDYLSVIDMNMGYNKVGMLVDRDILYEIAVEDDGRGTANLTIDYTNNAPFEAGETGCYQDTIEEYVDAPAYLDFTDECFWNYLRVYTPGGAVLRNSSTHTVPAETTYSGRGWTGEATAVNEFAGWTTFANYILVPQQQTETVTLSYELPTIVQQNDEENIYQLTFSPQPGAGPQDIQVMITLPPNSTVLELSDGGEIMNGNQILYNLALDKDIIISVRYR